MVFMLRDTGLLLMRLGFGGLMLLFHGAPKLLGFSENVLIFPDPLGVGSQFSLILAIFAEVFCAAAVVLGLLFRFALVPLIVTMGVAFILVHGADPFVKKELSAVYLTAFTSMLFLGPGTLSLDSVFRSRRR